MKAPLIFFLVLVLVSSNASAWCLPAPFNIIDEKVFDGDWDIASEHGDPDKTVRGKGFVHARVGSISFPIWCHIRAKLDIVGFRNMSIINGTNYVDGNASDFAIVKHSATYEPLISMYNPSLDNPVYVGGVFDCITSNVVVKDIGNKTIATQTVTLKWYFIEIDSEGNEEVVPVTEKKSFSVSVESPETFNNSIDDYEITITSYNNSVTPYTLIYVPPRENIIKQSVHYKNDTSSWYNLTGLVKENDRGTEHVRFINKTGFIIDENKTITRRAEYFVINEAPLNWSLLNISVFTPYIEKTDSICNATIYNSKPSDFVAWKPIATLIGILASFMIGAYIVVRRI